MPPAGAGCQSAGTWSRTRDPPALPMTISCSASASRFSRTLPVTRLGSTRAAPVKSSSSSTVNSSCSGGHDRWRSPSASCAASAAMARAMATPMPSSAPRVVPGAWTQPSTTSGKTPSIAGSVPAVASASHTMSRCAWSTTASRDAAPRDAGISATTLPAASALAVMPRSARRARTCRRTASSCLDRRGIAHSAANSSHTGAGSRPSAHAVRSPRPVSAVMFPRSSVLPARESSGAPGLPGVARYASSGTCSAHSVSAPSSAAS